MHYSPSLIFLPIAACVLVLCGTASAAIRTVTNLNDSGAGSLRATIAAASSGDTIRFAVTGTIALTSGKLAAPKSLNIEGPGLPAALHITRSAAAGTPGFQIFDFYSPGALLTVRLSGLTISNGQASNSGGGAIYVGGDLTVSDCIFDDNSASLDGGGAIKHVDGSLAVTNCVFSNNFAAWSPSHDSPGAGGAVYSRSSDKALVFTNTVFTGNHSDFGGGAIALSGESGVSLTVHACTFTSNEAGLSGGAISASSEADNSTLTITQSTFSNNRGTAYGGACSVNFGNATVRSTLFSGNSCADGGGLFNWRSLTVENCTFSRNRAVSGEGGGIFNQRSLAVRSCTFSGNTAFIGGAIHQGGFTTATSLLGNNILDSSPNLSSQTGTMTSQGYNLCSDNGSGFLTAAGDQLTTNPQLDPLGPQNNGGPTKTIALLSTSPALDRGHSMGLLQDQRGHQRPLELFAYQNASGSDASDIGAFESGDPVQPSFIVVTTLHDHDDGVAGIGDCTLREAIARANALRGADITFLSGLQGTLALDRNLGPLTVTEYLALTGPGARLLAVSAGGSMRVLHFSGSASRGKLAGLTIRDGRAEGLPAMPGLGGGIYNEGVLECRDCAFDAHTARGGTATTLGGHGSNGHGGGIYNTRNLTLERCTFTGCQAFGSFGNSDLTPGGVGTPPGRGGNGGSGRGGAVYHAGISLTVNQCTFQGNNASGSSGGNGFQFGGGGGNGQGGAIYGSVAGMQFNGSTVAGNYSLGGSGGLGSNAAFDGPAGFGSGAVTALNPSGLDYLRSTVIAGNLRNGNFPVDVGGAFISGGYNFIGSAGTATGLTQATDQKGTNAAPLNPLLGPLQNNGGQTNTLSPLAGSLLIDKGQNSIVTTDQRGLPRPLDALSIPNAAGGDASDIGAVETDVSQTGPVFVVNSLDDHDDGSATYLDCTLREALNAAFYAAGADTVMFQPGLTGVITLTPGSGNLRMYDSVTLIGPGARKLTVQRGSGDQGRILLAQGGPHHLSGLTITGGALQGNTGGQPVQGAGILSQGILTVSDCSITRNTARGGDNDSFPGLPGGASIGGGVANVGGGSLTLLRCSISLNGAYGGRGANAPGIEAAGRGGDASGGAIYNDTGCTLTVINCTIYSNAATGGNVGGGVTFPGPQGGHGYAAVYNRGSMTVTATTLMGNGGSGGSSGFGTPRGNAVGGLLAVAGSANLVQNTLNADNYGNFVRSDISGAFTSGGYNLIGNADTGTGFTAATDQRGTASTPLNARFGAYFNYGGPTDTVGLLPNSPALDRGKNFGLSTDQRGAARTFDDPALTNAAGGDGTDIGAFETVPAYTGPLTIISVNRQGTALHILVQGQAGRNYRLQTSPALQSWLNAGSPMPADFLGQVEFIDPAPSAARMFYRALEVP